MREREGKGREKERERVSRNSGKRESLMRFIAWVKGLANERQSEREGERVSERERRKWVKGRKEVH